jgi:hypothetical protein
VLQLTSERRRTGTNCRDVRDCELRVVGDHRGRWAPRSCLALRHQPRRRLRLAVNTAVLPRHEELRRVIGSLERSLQERRGLLGLWLRGLPVQSRLSPNESRTLKRWLSRRPSRRFSVRSSICWAAEHKRHAVLEAGHALPLAGVALAVLPGWTVTWGQPSCESPDSEALLMPARRYLPWTASASGDYGQATGLWLLARSAAQ